MQTNTIEPYVLQCAIKNTHKSNNKDRSPQKNTTAQLVVHLEGCAGDYNNYRTRHKNSTNDRAVSLITTNLLDSFREEGWDVSPGDLGENITLFGDIFFEIGDTFTIGTVILQITEDIEPCNNLMFLPYIGRENRKAFINTLNGRRGWYAKVLTEGTIIPGDIVKKI